MAKHKTRNSSAKAGKAMGSASGKKSNRIALIMFPIVLIALIVLIAVLNQQSNEAGKKEAEKAVASFDLADQPKIGSPDAKVTIVEFGDFKCPGCKQWTDQVYPQLKTEYIDTGKVQLVFMNFPVVGSDSYTAAYAAEAVFANHPEAYWDYHDALYKAQQVKHDQWATADHLVEIAKQSVPVINADQLKKDIEDQNYRAQVQTDIALGEKAKIDGTPSFFVNGKMYDGNYLKYSDLKKMIEEELKAVK